MENNGHGNEKIGIEVCQITGKINKHYPDNSNEYSTAKNFSTNECYKLIKKFIPPSVVYETKTLTFSQEFDSSKVQDCRELYKKKTTNNIQVFNFYNFVLKVNKCSLATFKIYETSNRIAKAKLIEHVLMSSEDLTKYLNSKYPRDPKHKRTKLSSVDTFILEEICNNVIYLDRKNLYEALIMKVMKNGTIHGNEPNPTYIIAGQIICLFDRNDNYCKPVFRMNHFIEDGNVIKVTDIKIPEEKMSYSTLSERIPKSLDFQQSLIYFINGDQENLFNYTHNQFHATALVAMLISEVIRNPIMIFINIIAIKSNFLHTFDEYHRKLPSLAGGTWKGHRPYGATFLQKLDTFLNYVNFSDLSFID
nr:uncharacterized protein LOC111975005 [Salvelinus alpinus]